MSKAINGFWRNLTYGLFDDGEKELPSQAGQESREELTEIVCRAREEWLNAQSYFNSATEPELVDHAILSVQAAERKYMYWLQQIKKLD
ncbi:MAG TPA: DUF2508 family protein [Firmicutes bacterium]|nr:DUF2508 family protein [Bacillota bacterium]